MNLSGMIMTYGLCFSNSLNLPEDLQELNVALRRYGPKHYASLIRSMTEWNLALIS